MLAHDSIPHQSVPDAMVPVPAPGPVPAPQATLKLLGCLADKNFCPLGITAESERLSCPGGFFFYIDGRFYCAYQGRRRTRRPLRPR
jgi:hypothetical protein